VKEYDMLEKIQGILESGNSARTYEIGSEDEQEALDALCLITTKPVLYLCNVDESSAKDGNEYSNKVKEAVANENAEVLIIGTQIESEIAEMDTFEDRQMFLEEIGLTEPGVYKLIQSAYKLLNLQTYFTAGVKEVRAWTVPVGATAPQAAGVIHTDFEKGFIRAEVIKYDDYIEFKSEAAIKDAGKMGVEGKSYIVQDGDIMHFRFNV
jgi:GTP-binding protein YchF